MEPKFQVNRTTRCQAGWLADPQYLEKEVNFFCGSPASNSKGGDQPGRNSSDYVD